MKSLGTDLGVYQGELAPGDLITSAMLQILASGVLPCKADGQVRNQFQEGRCYILGLREVAPSLSSDRLTWPGGLFLNGTS